MLTKEGEVFRLYMVVKKLKISCMCGLPVHASSQAANFCADSKKKVLIRIVGLPAKYMYTPSFSLASAGKVVCHSSVTSCNKEIWFKTLLSMCF